MKLDLQKLHRESAALPFDLAPDTRLPAHLHTPCRLEGEYAITRQDRYFTVRVRMRGTLTGTCQRCMEPFEAPFRREVNLAVTRTDADAGELMDNHEVITAPEGVVDLEEILVDELHLSAPLFHAELHNCRIRTAAD